MTNDTASTLPTINVSGRASAGAGAFSVVITGDVCPQLRGEERILAGEEAAIFAKVAPFLTDADLSIVQWETPLASQPNPIPKSGPNLNCAPATARLAAVNAFDLALLANNHIGDQGPAAVVETMGHLRAVGVRSVGAGANLTEAEAPAVFEIGGRSLAVLNFAENEFGGATGTRAGFSPLSPLRNLAAIREARQQHDLVIVALHGGHERNPFPSPRMQALFRAYAEAGAHVVFNCHTHCPEGVEFHQGTPVVHCPGNFYFPKPAAIAPNPVWWTGYLPKFHFDAKGCHTVELLPYVFNEDEVAPLTGDAFAEFERYFQKLCQPLSNPAELQALFESWSSHSAQGYLTKLSQSIPPDWVNRLDDREVFQRLLGLRNQFTCESHADMSACYLRLVEEGRLEEARKRIPELLAYQTPSWGDPSGTPAPSIP